MSIQKVKYVHILIFTSLFIPCLIFAQDSLQYHAGSSSKNPQYLSLRRNVIPAGLITAGLLTEIGHIKYNLQDAIPRTHTRIENGIQYAPIVILYGADLMKIEHQNSVFNQTKYLIFSEAATAILTHLLKNTVREARPSGGYDSFPSGHTSQSFTAATVLFNEFEYDNKPVAWSGYLFSTATGVLQVTNNRHWVPDVLTGAGVAVIVTNLVYYFHPLKNWDPFHGKDHVRIVPDIDPYLKSCSIRVSCLL